MAIENPILFEDEIDAASIRQLLEDSISWSRTRRHRLLVDVVISLETAKGPMDDVKTHANDCLEQENAQIRGELAGALTALNIEFDSEELKSGGLDLSKQLESESYNQKTKILDTIFSFDCLDYIILNSNNIKSIPKEINNMYQLLGIELKSNLIQKLPIEIVDLPYLIHVDLDSNQLQEFPFRGGCLDFLSILKLTNNQLESIETIQCVPNLMKLYLNQNQIESIPLGIELLKNLTLLDLSDNRLRSIPNSLSQIEKLTNLYISGNVVNSLPISLLKNIKIVDASQNEIKDFIPDGECLSTSTIIDLDLSYNIIETLPDCLFQLKSLQKLDLSNNLIEHLPESIQELTSLESLKIAFNHLQTLSQELASLKKLKVLDIYGNLLQKFPRQIIEIDRLSDFSCEDNPFFDDLEEKKEAIGCLIKAELMKRLSND